MNIFENKLYQFLLVPFSLFYWLIIGIRNWLYDHKIFRSLKIESCKIISVGNISVGGTGKTPVIKFLATYLKDQGVKVSILSRGYRRKGSDTVIVTDGERLLAGPAEAGDEPYLLARQLSHVAIVVEADRYKGALTIQQQFQPDIILLDDGFQHRRLHRDFDIVLVDASVSFGRGLLLPAGFLREPIKSLNRADLIWLTRVDQARKLNELIEQIKNQSSSPLILSEHRAVEIIHATTLARYQLSFMHQKSMLLFSGIANPKSFETTVADSGGDIKYHLIFSDHYQYRPKDINRIMNKAKLVDAEIILTTEKDFARLGGLIQNATNIFYLTVAIGISSGAEEFQHQLTRVLSMRSHQFS